MTDPAPLRAREAIGLGLACCLVLALGLFGWAARALITSAVVASGEVDALPFRHPVQHPEGGVVAQVFVREGQQVEAGQPLLRLDGTALEAESALVEAQANEARARLARLGAERDRTPFPPVPEGARDDPAATAAYLTQERLFDARLALLREQLEQLRQRRLQAEAALAGLERQSRDLEAAEAVVTRELATQQSLQAQGLAASARATALERDRLQLAADIAELSVARAAQEGRVTEAALQASTLWASRRQEAEEQMNQTGMQLVELEARRAVLGMRRRALILRAPVSGAVYGLAINGAEAVLRPAEAAMQILTRDPVPHLALRARPDDIDHLHIGQPAMLRFPALAAHDLPELVGTVTAISAATFADERSGARYFRVEVALTDSARAALGARTLVPGMAVQAFIATGQRTPLGYLLGPIGDHMRRALREP